MPNSESVHGYGSEPNSTVSHWEQTRRRSRRALKANKALSGAKSATEIYSPPVCLEPIRVPLIPEARVSPLIPARPPPPTPPIARDTKRTLDYVMSVVERRAAEHYAYEQHPELLVARQEYATDSGENNMDQFFEQQALCADILRAMQGTPCAETLTHNRAGVVIMNNSRATVNNTIVIGDNNELSGDNNLVIGDNNVVRGDNNRSRGARNKLHGRYCTNHDTGTLGIASGGFSVRTATSPPSTARSRGELHQLLAQRYSACGSTSSGDENSPSTGHRHQLRSSSYSGSNRKSRAAPVLSRSDLNPPTHKATERRRRHKKHKRREKMPAGE